MPGKGGGGGRAGAARRMGRAAVSPAAAEVGFLWAPSPPRTKAPVCGGWPRGREPLRGHLAAVGCALLRRVAANPAGGRELALDLLAADAFVTYAFEAQADADPAGLAALAGRVEREVSAA